LIVCVNFLTRAITQRNTILPPAIIYMLTMLINSKVIRNFFQNFGTVYRTIYFTFT
jgi:hypothetical protein